MLFTFNPVVSGNAWSVTVPGTDHLPDGSYTIKADVSDGVGNQAPEAKQTLTVDETAPAAPGVALTSDTGSSSSDHITNNPALTLTNIESGAKVEYSLDGGTTWSISAPTIAQLVQGSNTVDVRQTDVAGNVSGLTAFTFTLDTVVPAIAITTPIAGDNIVNAAEAAAGFTIQGTTSGVADGQTATVTIVNSANVVLDTYTPIVSGNAWSITVTQTQAQALANGSYTVKADVLDVAGNAAVEASQTLTVNGTAPTIAITTPIAGDNVVNAAEAAAGFAIGGTTSNVEDGQIATIAIVNSANVVLDTYSPIVSGNAWSITVTPTQALALADGAYTVKADVSNKAGNLAVEASQALVIDETDDHWTGGAGGNWSTASNWASGLPTSTMNARLDFSGTYTVTSSSNVTINGLSSIPTVTLNIQGGTFTVANFAGQGPLIVSGGTFAIGSSTANVMSFTQSGGELNGTGTLTVTGTGPVPASNFSNGTQSGSGTTLAQNGATFSSTGFGLDGGRTLQLGGASTTSGASVQINLNSSNPNNSVSDVGSGTLTILSGATFTDATTGGLTIFATNHGTGDTGVTAAVNNAGTFTKTASAATSTISTLFNNTGTVNVTSGSTLNLSGGGTDVGAVYAGAGTIEFGGGTRTLDATSSITGNALFAGNATTFTTVNGGVGTGLMTITAGTATFNGTVTTGGLTQSGGELNGTGTLTVTGTGPVPASSFSNGTQSGSGTTLAQNGATFSSTGFGLDGGRTLQLGGASTTSGASVQINLNSSNPNNSVSDVGSGTLTILSGATFTDATTGGLTIFATNHGTGDTGVTAAVNNAGTFTKTASGDLDHQHAVQQHRDRERHIGQHAEPERRWYGCRGGLRRCWHH